VPIMGLDRDLALSRVGGDLDLLKEIAVIFLDDLPRTIAEIQDAITASDFEVMERSAHGLKGAAANFGAQSVVEAALHLEKLGRQKDLSSAAEALEHLKLELSTFAAELETLCHA
jgi:two-component system, sensor histidine kinase and response regulator